MQKLRLFFVRVAGFWSVEVKKQIKRYRIPYIQIMKKALLYGCLILLSSPLFARQNDLSPYIPKGYILLFQYTADLNADSLPDKIIVIGIDKSLGDAALKSIFSSDVNMQKRPVIILLGQPDHSYKRVTRNDNAIAQSLGTKDPFSSIKCETGSFIIEHTIDSPDQQCTIDSRFEWSAKQSDWYLKSYSQSCISAKPSLDPEDTGFKEKTPKNFGKIPFGKYKYPMAIDVDEWGQ